VFHDAPDHHFLAITDGINIDLYGILEELIKQYGQIRRYFDGHVHIRFQTGIVKDNFHRSSTEDV
jgi:hypothetical protein